MKNYILTFASGSPTLVTGLAPTMTFFSNAASGATLVGPAVTEINTGWGMYTFQWGTTTPIAFICDGATSGLGTNRYVFGALDPADRADEYGNTLVAIGTSIYAQNQSLAISVLGIGTVGSTFGSVSSDPIDLFGYMKRIQENLEGNSQFTKLTGAWQISTRGSSTVLANKTVTNTSSLVTKS